MRLYGFRPVADRRSKILILGTMPGPTALKKQEYYGFSGNHFWKIMFQLFGVRQALSYPEKIKLLRENRIALWDVFRSCRRSGAADQNIEGAKVNAIPALLKKYPNIKTIFLNGRTAEKTFLAHFSNALKLPSDYLPSTSPAHAGMPFTKKLKSWSAILNRLK